MHLFLFSTVCAVSLLRQGVHFKDQYNSCALDLWKHLRTVKGDFRVGKALQPAHSGLPVHMRNLPLMSTGLLLATLVT